MSFNADSAAPFFFRGRVYRPVKRQKNPKSILKCCKCKQTFPRPMMHKVDQWSGRYLCDEDMKAKLKKDSKKPVRKLVGLPPKHDGSCALCKTTEDVWKSTFDNKHYCGAHIPNKDESDMQNYGDQVEEESLNFVVEMKTPYGLIRVFCK